ncbi:hypothetical protein CBL_12761 [Carabus blaptoides fortunei]
MPDNIEANVVVVKEQKRPIILAVSTITIALLVVIGIIIYLTVDSAKTVLFTFLGLIIAIGIAMIIYTEIQRRKSIQRKNKEGFLGINPSEMEYRNYVTCIYTCTTLRANYI